MDPVARLRASIDQTRPIVAALSADQHSMPTPCPDWDVRALTNHLLGALVMFRDVATDGQADMAALDADLIGDGSDLAATYDALSASTVGAWSEAGKVDGAGQHALG